MTSQAKAHLTVEEYLAQERQASGKSEYFNGESFAMAGASRRHNLIALNLAAELRAQLKQGPCEVYVSEMRVKVSRTGLYTYPDVVVVCEDAQFEDDQVDTLLNPVVLVEVLSPSTADYDRGGKFEHYRTLASLQDYLLVAQDQYHVVHYTRQQDSTWLLSETSDRQGSLHLFQLRCDLLLSEVYAKVKLDR
jgi:Uma2 family endonuclease